MFLFDGTENRGMLGLGLVAQTLVLEETLA